jgi:hypothetical protein
MRYRVCHDDVCGCVDRRPYACATAAAVALFLWGRDAPRHIVYDGECPYRFHHGDVTTIQHILEQVPAAAVRQALQHAPVAPRTTPGLTTQSWAITIWDDGARVLCDVGTAVTRRG